MSNYPIPGFSSIKKVSPRGQAPAVQSAWGCEGVDGDRLPAGEIFPGLKADSLDDVPSSTHSLC